jgi:hypothetical protein
MINTTRIEESAHTAPFGPPESSFEVPRESLLDGFAQMSDGPERLDIRQLAIHDQLILHTQNTQYRLILLDPDDRRVLMQGGRYFPESTEVTLVGASVGGAMLKLGWIVQGLQLELLFDAGQPEPRNIITSPVTLFYLVSA